MADAGRPELDRKLPANLRLLVLKNLNARQRREGSLAAALVQSMALAVITTAGSYPSWVMVTGEKDEEHLVLGATWSINQDDPRSDSPLLGSTGRSLLMAIAICCLLSVLTGSLAIGWDFLGRRKSLPLAPVLHFATAFLITCSAAFGSTLLAVVRGQARTLPGLRVLKYTVTAGQSLYLSFLACALTSTATGFSCSSPARMETSSSSRDMGRALRGISLHKDVQEPPGVAPRYYSWQDEIFFDLEETVSSSQEDEAAGPADWYSYLKRELTPQTSWKDRWWGRRQSSQQQQQPALGEEQQQWPQPMAQEEERATEKPRREPKPLLQRGMHREISPPRLMEEGAVHLRQLGEKETDQEDPGRGDAELQLSLTPESQRVKSGDKLSQTSEGQAAEAGLLESHDWEKQDPTTIAM